MAFKKHADYVAYHAAYRAARREKLKLESRAYRKSNPEVEKEWRRDYLAQNGDAVRARKARYHMKTQKHANEISRRNHYKRKYGIFPEEKQAMIDRQNQKCAICSREIDMRSGHLDHIHMPFQIREVLCRYCNPGLGNFFDNPVILEKAAAYLRRHSTFSH